MYTKGLRLEAYCDCREGHETHTHTHTLMYIFSPSLFLLSFCFCLVFYKHIEEVFLQGLVKKQSSNVCVYVCVCVRQQCVCCHGFI